MEIRSTYDGNFSAFQHILTLTACYIYKNNIFTFIQPALKRIFLIAWHSEYGHMYGVHWGLFENLRKLSILSNSSRLIMFRLKLQEQYNGLQKQHSNWIFTKTTWPDHSYLWRLYLNEAMPRPKVIRTKWIIIHKPRRYEC